MDLLGESDVHVWYRITTLLGNAAVQLADRHLSGEERSRRDRLHFEADRRDFTIAHDLLRRALSKYKEIPPADWRFATNDYGKPLIAGFDPQMGALSFSLSHTRGCVACAIAPNAPVGVDVEQTDRLLCGNELADRFFSEDEAAWLRQCSVEIYGTRFAELWTLKEAYLKALGVGLSGPLDSISFRFDEHGRIDFMGPSMVQPREWHFALFEPSHSVRLGVVVRSVDRPHFSIRQDGDEGRPLAPVRVSA
ncbi:MAG: 4'-phosphopantetheinyl transferase family protein [Terriglobia bacterium]